ncbi:LpqB family beta-propeller domain-containing protein [Streptomyces sp. E11-3]|uniref:LpqB family beta-propeller domain-containing protein n=1 Tax=Streptomyces sp. E11-3 TaxID=3110112 RepID=UPI0039817353
MPDNGGVGPVEASPKQPQVRVFAKPPRKNAPPSEIVEGFLEALTSDDPKYSMARKYLTKKARQVWQPDLSTTVLADGPNADTERTSRDSDGGGYTYALSGRRVATVNEQHAYQPEEGAYTETVHLTQRKDGQWRIDRLPAGVVLGESDFQRSHHAVNKYYFASRSSSDGAEAQEPRLVADPVYVRRWSDPVTETVKSLLKGPTDWLDPVVVSRFPTDTRLKKGTKALAPDDQNRLRVPLNERADRVSTSQCSRMAAQLFFTLKGVISSGVEQVELEKANGDTLCVLNADDADAIAPHRTVDSPGYQYFIDAEHRLVRLPKTKGSMEPVPGALGSGEQKLRTAAVSRDEDRAAGVSAGGQLLFVGSLLPGAALEPTKVRSEGKGEPDNRLTAPSWDGRGDLWVADRDPDNPRLLWLGQGEGDPVEVKVSGLEGGRITSVRVSADGVRVALLVEKDGKTALRIGRVEREGTAEQPEVAVRKLRKTAPRMEEVTAMSWAGGSRLVVAGKESGGVQQLRYVHSDGSVSSGTALPGLTAVTGIAASEDDRLPLVASSEDGIVRLPPGANWRTVVKDGSAPVYPG